MLDNDGRSSRPLYKRVSRLKEVSSRTRLLKSNSVIDLPSVTALTQPKMITLQVSERVTRVFPSSLIGTSCAKTAAEPLFLIDAKKHAIYLARLAIVILTRLAARHLPRQCTLRDTTNEYHWKQGNSSWISATSGTASLHLNNIPIERDSRTTPLAVADGTW